MTKDPTAALALGVNESYTLETGQALVAPPGCWMMVVPDVPIGKELGKDGEISQRCPVARMYTLMAPVLINGIIMDRDFGSFHGRHGNVTL